MNSLHKNRDAVLKLIGRRHQPGQRLLVAIAGPPGSGKSTLAEAVVRTLNSRHGANAALLPMDGFHLDTEVLESRGLVSRRGAPETFDVRGFVQLIQSVRAAQRSIHYPVYDRSQERAIPDAATLSAETDIVIVEGNYLLLGQPVWQELHGLFDVRIFLDCALDTLESRLMNRWLSFGYQHEDAARKVEGNDLKNARRVIDESIGADLVLKDDPLAL